MKKILILLLLFAGIKTFGQTFPKYVDISTPNSGLGTPLRTAWSWTNDNWASNLDSILNKYTKIQVRNLVRDSLNARVAAAHELEDYTFLKANVNTPGNAVDLEYLQSYIGGGTIGIYELKGTVGTTTGIPVNGDSLIINTGFVTHPHPLVYKNGILQNHLTGNTHNTVSVAKVGSYVFSQSTGTIIVRPTFSTGDVLIVHAFDPIVWTSLTPEGGGGGGGGGGGSPLLDSLVAIWKLDESVGNTANEPVAGLNGTLYGATPGATGKIGFGVTFAATNSIIIPYNAALSPTGDRMSVSLWFKPSSLASTAGHALNLWTSYDATSHVTQNINVDNTNDYIYCDFMNTTGTEYLAHNTTPIVAGNWYHIVAVCDGTGRPVKLYVNNVSFSGNTFSGTLHTTNDVSVIGNQNMGYSPSALGVIDDVVLSRQRFTVADVALLWAGGVGSTWPW